MLKLITQGNPAAGAEFTITVPAGKYWSVKALYATFAAANTLTTRFVHFTVDDGTTVFYKTGNITGQNINSTRTYSLSPRCVQESASAASSVFAVHPLPACVLGPGYNLKSLVYVSAGVGIQATDQWSTLALLVDEETMEFGLTRR